MTDGLYEIGPSNTEWAASLEPGGPIREIGAGEWAARPDAHFVQMRDGQLVGRVSLWWTGQYQAGVGAIGHAAWGDADTGTELVRRALIRLRDEGCTSVLGPLDGSTWRDYRVVVDAAPSGVAAPRFATEPFPEPQVAHAFERMGFAPVAHYVSARVDALPDRADEWTTTQRRLRETGITIRSFDRDHVDDELTRLYPLILDAFADNLFYTPLSEADFRAMYGPAARNEHSLVLIAERAREPVGFHYGFRDLAQAMRGEPVDTLICKTLAVAPSVRGRGLGGALTLGLEEAGRARGLTRAIHALMHEANDSLKISRHGARPIRRYALLGRDL